MNEIKWSFLLQFSQKNCQGQGVERVLKEYMKNDDDSAKKGSRSRATARNSSVKASSGKTPARQNTPAKTGKSKSTSGKKSGKKKKKKKWGNAQNLKEAIKISSFCLFLFVFGYIDFEVNKLLTMELVLVVHVLVSTFCPCKAKLLNILAILCVI